MFIELSDEMVSEVVITELKWSYEYCLKDPDEEGNTVRRDALEEVLEYFMPFTEFSKYMEEVQEKYGS